MDRDLDLLERAAPAITRTHTVELYDGRNPDITFNPDDPASVNEATGKVNALLAQGYKLFPEDGPPVTVFDPNVETAILASPLVGG